MRPIPVIETILSTPALWRGRQMGSAEGRRVVRSGWPMLDALLPGGGWPLGSLIEIGVAAPGCGECALFFPIWSKPATADADARRKKAPAKSRAVSSKRAASVDIAKHDLISLIDPPFLPYAPGWQQSGIALSRLWWITAKSERQRLWAAEQSLRSGVCASVLLWPNDIDANALRRLQLAAESSEALGLCFRPEQELAHASHAPIRLHLRASAQHWHIELIKCRGRTGGAKTVIPRDAAALPMIDAPIDVQTNAPKPLRDRLRSG